MPSKITTQIRDTIKQRTRELLRQHGAGVRERGLIVLSLMAEFNISDQSAVLNYASQKKRMNPAARRGLK